MLSGTIFGPSPVGATAWAADRTNLVSTLLGGNTIVFDEIAITGGQFMKHEFQRAADGRGA